jgi:autotransporter-associated beta strand protein
VQALLAGGAGGLTKNGAGLLTLQGTNTFTGNVQVNEGGLMLYSAHQGSGSVTCVDGTTFGVNSSGPNQVVRLSSITLGSTNGGTLRARFGGGQSGYPTEPAGYVTNLTLHGTITVNVDFSVSGVPADHVVPLFGYGTLNGSPTFVRGAIGGSGDADWVVVNNSGAKQIQLVPSTVAWSSSGGSLTLTWPLLGTIIQSNSVSVDVPGSWFDIPASASVTNWNITPDPATPNVFYRLRFP